MAESVNIEDVVAWRARLFSIAEELALTPDQFDTFFPYVDNVYKIHGRSSNSKLATLTETMYYQCRIDNRAEKSSRKPKETHSLMPEDDVNSVPIDPAVVAASSDEVFTAALLEEHNHGLADVASADQHTESPGRPMKRTRNRKPRETCQCNMKIKVVRNLDENWKPIKYVITRTSEEGHSHDISMSDRIVKNHKVLELMNPDQPLERKRLTAKEKRAYDVEALLQQIHARYNELEDSLREQYPNDKKRLDTTMRKWVNELQRTGSQFLASPLESFLYT
ncbi:hypothetical protein POJ06DRAFT_255905 [Lipomyces tetrasporus]|uniref:Uncharacterized protein n=1 Tax=Lipomyces tetrasporus TaxID=54092 RepID=A0AAD7VSJ6_9ASCO|nr:uncharacterized protein POJ06DRAFT_255905 [Lipomyces tetrasporus]KAJ8099085.1 hypothetical protein POJ06DRAFT_255905 [Lipomyces tetrasporus]